MARVQISRGDAYVAGDMIIQMFIDGEKAGSLIGAKPLDLELPPGLYTVQARILGIQRGEAVVFSVYDDTKELAVTVSGTRLGLVNNVTTLLIWLAILFVPDRMPWQLAAGLVIAVICGIDVYRWWKMKPQRLRLNVTDEIRSTAIKTPEAESRRN